MGITTGEIDLAAHLGPSTLAIAASDDAVWVMGARRLLRIAADGEVRSVLEAPGTDTFVQLSAAGRHVAVATYDAALFASRGDEPFTRVPPPAGVARATILALRARVDGGLWLGIVIGQPVRRRWWHRSADGRWEERIDRGAEVLRERYGIVRPDRDVVSPCLDRHGSLVGLDDRREANDVEDDPGAPLYVRRQTLVELTTEGWSALVDLELAGVPRIVSGSGDALWNGSVALASAREGDEPVWLVARADALYRVSRGRADRVALAASELVSDGDRMVLAVVPEDPEPAEASLHLSRDAGRTFEALPALAPRELARGAAPPYRAAATFFRGVPFLAVVARDRPDHAPTRAWIVRGDRS